MLQVLVINLWCIFFHPHTHKGESKKLWLPPFAFVGANFSLLLCVFHVPKKTKCLYLGHASSISRESHGKGGSVTRACTNKGLPEPRVASGSTRLGRRGSVSIKRRVQTPPRRRPLDTPNHLLVSGWRQQEPASELQNQENFSYVPYVYILRQHVSGVTFANYTCMKGNTGVLLSWMIFGFFFLPASVPLQLSLLLSLDAASPFPSSFCHSTHWLLFPTRLLQASLPKHCGGHIPLLGRLVGSSPSSSSHPVWLRLCNHAISSFLKQFLCWGPIQQFSGLESCLISFQNKFFGLILVLKEMASNRYGEGHYWGVSLPLFLWALPFRSNNFDPLGPKWLLGPWNWPDRLDFPPASSNLSILLPITQHFCRTNHPNLTQQGSVTASCVVFLWCDKTELVSSTVPKSARKQN